MTLQASPWLGFSMVGAVYREADEEEANADLGAFQREYEDDHSWEALQEDEFGRLRPLVPRPQGFAFCMRHIWAAARELVNSFISPCATGHICPAQCPLLP